MSYEYKVEVLEFVERQLELGQSRCKYLVTLEISPSTYYSWKKAVLNAEKPKKPAKPHPMKLTPGEKELIIATKKDNPTMRHRQIQGLIQAEGCYISPSSVFTVLKANGMVEPFERREAPRKVPKYEVRGRNLVWGTDWTKLKINHETWQLLTLIDFFSRKMLAISIYGSFILLKNSSHGYQGMLIYRHCSIQALI
ncbi:MAG: hypothetical protein ACOH5I_23190 [Oligoflexus sp.]